VLIKRNTVRASSLIMYDLDIYRVADGNHFKVLSMPIEETADAACLTQKYVYSIVDSPAGGMELRMRRQIEKRDSDCDDLPPKEVMFPDAERVIRFDVK
jgi:hypothetical protein